MAVSPGPRPRGRLRKRTALFPGGIGTGACRAGRGVGSRAGLLAGPAGVAAAQLSSVRTREALASPANLDFWVFLFGYWVSYGVNVEKTHLAPPTFTL